MNKARQELIAIAIRNQGDWNSIYADIQAKAIPSEEELTKAENVDCITILDSEYPESLRQGFRPPFVLFYKGNKALLNDTNIIAVVGGRNPKERIVNFTEKFVSSRNETIISGLSLGIDTKALETALKNGNKVIAVLGGGIDNCYPTQNQALYNEIALKGLLISEYPFDISPLQENFIRRNNIIANLSNKVCVMEMKKQSGTMMLINFALQDGKEIYIVPDIEEEDNAANQLIDEGAHCLTLSTTI